MKTKPFPLWIFVSSFFVFAAFTTLQMKIIGRYIDYAAMPRELVVLVLALWLLAASGFTLLTRWQVARLYQKPIENFAKAARRVANGDFSVYVPPRHTADHADYLDVVFTDFNTMVGELGSIETLKTDFFSNVSHEFRTPLAAIQNYAELLCQRGLSEEKQLEYASSIGQSAKRLSSLITNLLKLNKLEKQTIRPAPAPYDLCRQLCDCALSLEDQWERKDIEFIPELEEAATICADENLMEIVWNNLLGNAIKFTPPGGSVTLRQTSAAHTVTVVVSDTGCGMDEETIKHIFDKFYQGDTSHSTEGNGLGLALALRILELTGCTITAKSAPGEGSAFVVVIPAAKGDCDHE